MTDKVEASGLEDVVAATTRLSDVDGEAGRLVLAGKTVEDLAGSATFEDVMHLLWWGHLPSAEEREEVRAALGLARVAAYERLGEIGGALSMTDAMDALRAATAHLPSHGLVDNGRHATRAGGDLRTGGFAEALTIAGATAVFAAASAQKASPLRPDPSATHAADYLRMATGEAKPPAAADALDAYLVTVVDHGMNASTFTARVIASTASDTVSAIVGALGALKGKLHGGAPGPVLDMLDAIGDPKGARAWLQAALDRGERIMGMGHRIYRVRDPRAFVLERAVGRFEAASTAKTATGERLRLARAVEAEAQSILEARYPTRPLRANVEFYTAVLLEAVGLPRSLFTPTFAVSRVFGWCAHVEEQRRVGRLIRPRSRFIDLPRASAT